MSVLIVIRQELVLALRNYWVVGATVLLSMFALALGFLGAGQGAQFGVDVLSLTAASLSTLSVYLVPLIALLMSYDGIAGEIERGTLALTVATPIRRETLFLAKFLAQTIAVGGAIIFGFGAAGLAVGLAFGFEPQGLVAWGRLVAASVALGAVFVGTGLTLSAYATRVTTAAVFAIGTWLVLVVLYDLALLGAVIAAGDSLFTRDVFPWLVLANPADAFRIFNLAALNAAPVAGLDGLARTLPFPASFTLAVIAAWIAVALGLGLGRIRRIIL